MELLSANLQTSLVTETMGYLYFNTMLLYVLGIALMVLSSCQVTTLVMHTHTWLFGHNRYVL